jgi:hypothetical protein
MDSYESTDLVPPLSDASKYTYTDGGADDVEHEIIDLDEQDDSKPKTPKPSTPADKPNGEAS